VILDRSVERGSPLMQAKLAQLSREASFRYTQA
jgi:hypothetical protein